MCKSSRVLELDLIWFCALGPAREKAMASGDGSSSQETKGDGGEAWHELFMNSRPGLVKRLAAKRVEYPDRLSSHRLVPAFQRGLMPQGLDQHVPTRVCNLGSRTTTTLEVAGPVLRAPPFADNTKLDETNRADE